MDPAERSRLVECARAGDPHAFGVLLDGVSVRLALFIRRTGGRALGPDCDVDDLFQKTAANAWSLLPRFELRGPDSFYRWIVAIARGVVGNRVKYLEARGRGEVRHVESIVEGGADRTALDSATPISSLVARRDEIRVLDRALGTLDDLGRRLVERSVLEGATVTELAEETGLPRTTVWNRLAAAMSELKRASGREGAGG